jgi:hypothetical protein
MKNNIRKIFPVALLLLTFFGAGCSSIEIHKPASGKKFLASPNTLLVVHEGCGHPKPETFRAWIDKGQPTEQDIGEHFSYSQDRWSSIPISLPAGEHKLSAYADVSPWGVVC